MKNINIMNIDELITVLPEIRLHHLPDSRIYKLLTRLSLSIFEQSVFNTKVIESSKFSEFGNLIFPYTEMGSVSSIDIISSLNELIIFSYYLQNIKKYKKVVDIGANIGLHTLLMAKLGWKVMAYEPDPIHFDMLRKNIIYNKVENVETIDKAVSNKNGKTNFVRVIGNTTSSHISGAKDAPYGELQSIEVAMVDIKDIVKDIDYIKIDAEGHEAEIICAIPKKEFSHLDIIVEIGSVKNAGRIFEYCNSIGMNLFSQKIGWEKVDDLNDIPKHYKEGSLFISHKDTMNWN
jgi:FkbM family methyltransferase